MSDKLSDQAAQEVDKLLDKFDPFNISHNDFVRLKPQIKATLLALLYREFMDLIGEDEPDFPENKDKYWTYPKIRNRLRAELRQAAAQRYGQPEPEQQ